MLKVPEWVTLQQCLSLTLTYLLFWAARPVAILNCRCPSSLVTSRPLPSWWTVDRTDYNRLSCLHAIMPVYISANLAIVVRHHGEASTALCMPAFGSFWYRSIADNEAIRRSQSISSPPTLPVDVRDQCKETFQFAEIKWTRRGTELTKLPFRWK